MKKRVIALSCFAIGLAASAASAEGLYGSAAIGLSSPSDLTFAGSDEWGHWSTDSSFDMGMAVSAAVGYAFDCPTLRAELELGFQSNDYDKLEEPGYSVTARDGSLNVFRVFANGYYDFRIGGAFTPYVGAGIGFLQVDVDDLKAGNDPENHSYDDNVFGYQFIAGVSYAFSKNLALDLSYRFLGASDPSFDEHGAKTDYEFTGHNFMLGGRMNF